MLLGQAQLLSTGSEERCIPGNVEDIMPVWGFSNLNNFDYSPRFVKTHRIYMPIMSRPQRAVFVLRDPRETIASSYRMFCSRNNVESPEFTVFLQHYRHGLPGWIRMHQTWMPRATSVVHYRDLMFDAATTTLKMCQELGVDYSAEIIAKAAELTDQKNAANAEKKSGLRDAQRFDGTFQAVGPGNYTYAAELFDETHLEYVNKQLSNAGIELDQLSGSRSDSYKARIDIQFADCRNIDKQQVIHLFRNSNVPQVTKTFRAFDLSSDQASRIADYNGEDSYFLAFADGQPAGFGMLRGWDEGFAIPSLGVFVAPDFQGKGIGSRLMNHLTNVASERGCERIRLTVDRINKRAVALYEAQSYEIDPDQSDSGRFVMYRNLPSTVGRKT